MRFEFIDAHRTRYSVRMMCRLLQVSSSGYYAWCTSQPSQREMADRVYGAEVAAIHAESRATYGYERIWRELQARQVACGKHRVRRLMRQMQLVAKQVKRYKRTTIADPTQPVAPNKLGQKFIASRPNEIWAGDITYVPTRQGWLYLAVVLDLYSRRVVGWAMSNRITRQLVIQALEMALEQRRPEPGLIHHSDRGSQYTSHAFRTLLDKNGLVASMSANGNAYDNAVVESFFGTLKMELVYHASYQTRQQAETDIFFYIEAFYNRYRRHSTLGFHCPEAFERVYQDQHQLPHEAILGVH